MCVHTHAPSGADPTGAAEAGASLPSVGPWVLHNTAIYRPLETEYYPKVEKD